MKKNYKVYTIPKRNGALRTIYEPNAFLKYIQKQILKNILNNKAISKYAKAYKKGISLKENAIPHVGKKKILKLDIQNFFENISFYDIYDSCFSREYFPKSVGMLLTYLCTYEDHLVQGTPTSAYISNLVFKEFDEVLGFWCEEKGICYTRYSDDMTFSGDFFPSEVIQKVRKMLYRLGLNLNDEKIHVITQSQSQKVTGIVVNEKVQVSRQTRKEIRKEIYFIKKYGIESHLKKIGISISKDAYTKSLNGKISYILQINPEEKEFREYQKFLLNIL